MGKATWPAQYSSELHEHNGRRPDIKLDRQTVHLFSPSDVHDVKYRESCTSCGKRSTNAAVWWMKPMDEMHWRRDGCRSAERSSGPRHRRGRQGVPLISTLSARL